jgi:hypothetical protein
MEEESFTTASDGKAIFGWAPAFAGVTESWAYRDLKRARHASPLLWLAAVLELSTAAYAAIAVRTQNPNTY